MTKEHILEFSLKAVKKGFIINRSYWGVKLNFKKGVFEIERPKDPCVCPIGALVLDRKSLLNPCSIKDFPEGFETSFARKSFCFSKCLEATTGFSGTYISAFSRAFDNPLLLKELLTQNPYVIPEYLKGLKDGVWVLNQLEQQGVAVRSYH